MTIIYENFTDIASMPDHVAVTFFGVPLRVNFDDDGVITPRPIEAVTVNGVATSPELDPGPCRVEVCTDDWRETYDVMIPESGTHRLFELEEIIISAHKVIVKGDKGDVGAGVTLSGSVPTYADLSPGPWDLGAAFVVNADGLLYIYGTGGWPADGEGAAFRGIQGLSVNSVAITGNQLAFGLQDGTALPKVTVPALTQAAADAAAAALSRTAADSAKVETVAAKDATLTAKGQVDSARTDVLAAKTSVDASVTTVAADKATTISARDAALAAKTQSEGFASTASAQAGASAASAVASNGFAAQSQAQADRAFLEADRAEAAADEIATGAIADNAVSTIKVQDGAVTKPKLGASVQASLDKADSAIQGSDARLTDARTPTAHTHAIGNVTGLQTALDGKSPTVHTHTADQVDGLITEFTNMWAAIAGLGNPAVARTLAYCGGGPYTSSVPASGTATSFGARVPIMLPAATTRWRVKMRNYNGYTPANGAQPLSGSKLAIGKHALNTLGNSNGVFTSGTVRTVHNAAFTIPNTTAWWTSPWFTDPADQIPANEPYLFGWSATSTAQQLTAGVGEAWLFTGSGMDATDVTKTNGTMGTGNSTHGCPLDIVIEYDCTTARPSVLCVGDSIMEGLTGYTGTSFASSLSVPWYQSYPHQWANSCGAAAVNLAQWGTTTAQWLPTVTDRWNRADLSNGKFAGAIVALGSNDASSSVALATYQANMALIVGKVKALIAPGAPIYLVNVIGRNFSGAPETLRVSYNDWLATCPLGAKGVIDAAGSMTTPGFTPTMMAHLTMDGVHPNMTGNAHLAGLVGSRVQL